MKTYSTAQVAKMLGVHKVTLQNWLLDGKAREPRKVRVGNIDFRIWTDTDVKRLKRYKQQNYRKGRGRKPKPKR
jgi:predicted site-specific integrase-resolvase